MGAPNSRPRWMTRAGWTAAALVIVATAGACSARYTYLTSSSSHTYLAVPHGWKVFDQHQIEAAVGTTGSFPYFVYFDANPKPQVSNALTATSQPWGIERVRDLAGSEQVGFSFDSIDNELVQIDQLTESGSAQIDGQPRLLIHGTYRGVRQQVTMTAGDGSTVEFVQAGYVNNATNRVWALVVGCSATCFARNSGAIDRLVSSWTVGN